MAVTVTISDGRQVTFTGLKMAYCTKCQEVFTTVGNFDKHIRKNGKHVHPKKAGLQQNPKGIWKTPGTQEEQE